MKYPNNCLTGSLYLSDGLERLHLRQHLGEVWDDVDEEMKPYLIRMTETNKVSSVFCCWGHEETARYPQPGNLLFRASVPLATVFDKVLVPLQSKYHYSHTIKTDFLIGTQVWLGADNTTKIGYYILGLPYLEEHKHEFMNLFCDLVDTID